MISSPCVNYTWDPSQYAETDVYPEIFEEVTLLIKYDEFEEWQLLTCGTTTFFPSVPNQYDEHKRRKSRSGNALKNTERGGMKLGGC